MNYYTNVKSKNGKILFIGKSDTGDRIKKKISYQPSLWFPSDKGKFADIKGKSALEQMRFSSISECNNFLKPYRDMTDAPVYGNSKYDYAYISEFFGANLVKFNIDHLVIYNTDIEVGSENGFPNVEQAEEQITAITLNSGPGKPIFVFGFGDYDPKVTITKGSYTKHLDRIQYFRCDDEVDMLAKFVAFWVENPPDIITGWNINLFDLPYLLHRIKRILGEETALSLSPWNHIQGREVIIMGRPHSSYELFGINTIDYLDAFKKFSKNASQESYSLDFISNVVTGAGKLDYSAYGNIHDLWKTNYQVHIEYNIEDTLRVEEIDKKEKLISLAVNLAYESRVNINDVFSQVRMWTQIIRNDLLHNEKKLLKAIVPEPEDTSGYEGAYVKAPIVGMHDYVASGDFTSLYPHLIMGWNISPDTIVEPEDCPKDLIKWRSENVINVDNLLEKKIDTSILKKHNVSCAPNQGGQLFKNDHQGFLPRILDRMFKERDMYKKMMIEAEKNKLAATDPVKKAEFERQQTEYENFQSVKKVCLNSAYGALGNIYFILYDPRQAEAVTLAGQLAARYTINKTNEYMNKILKTKDEDYIVAADTDSMYLRMDELVRLSFGDKFDTSSMESRIQFMDWAWEKGVQDVVTNACKDLSEYVNCFEMKLHMKREVLANRGIWTGKKYYLLNVHNKEGVAYAKPKVVVKGLASQRTSTPKICRERLKDAWEIILNKDEEAIINYIAAFRSTFNELPLSQIAKPSSVNGLRKYAQIDGNWQKGTPNHVRAALTYNMMLDEYQIGNKYPKILEGEKIRFLYLKEPNHVRSHSIAFIDEIPKEILVDIEKQIDYDKQFEVTFLEPVKICLDAIGWNAEKQSSLWDLV